MEEVLNSYFSAYQDLEVHRLMLEDNPRTEAYRKAIFNNKEFLKGKVVMDVGCGTGILAIFCAQAGAKKVYAVEASSVASLALEVVRENKLENVIEVIQNRVENVILPEGVKLDAIVSEWMGFYLLHEGMLDSVLWARDNFLKEGGLMFPETGVIYIAPCSVPHLFEAWNDVHGVSMSTFGKCLRQTKQTKPEISIVKPEHLLGPETALCWIDLNECKVEELENITIKHVVGASKSGLYQGICVWFDCSFPEVLDNREEPRVVLSTSPHSPSTHWKQTVILLPEEQPVEENEPIAFQLDIVRGQDQRNMKIEVTLLDPDAVEHPLPCSCHMTKCILTRTYMLDHPMPDENGDAVDTNTNSTTNCVKDDILIEDKIDDDDV